MKTYTINEALKEISILFPINLELITGIYYEDGSKNKFILTFANCKFFIDLNSKTFKII
jgi:hypothetical protein